VATTRDDLVARPVTTGLGVLGMPGFTAYGGLRAIGKPRPGETVVVAARGRRARAGHFRAAAYYPRGRLLEDAPRDTGPATWSPAAADTLAQPYSALNARRLPCGAPPMQRAGRRRRGRPGANALPSVWCGVAAEVRRGLGAARSCETLRCRLHSEVLERLVLGPSRRSNCLGNAWVNERG